MNLPKQINDEIWDYCRNNSVTNIDEFVIKLVRQGFTVEKFGATPQINEKIVEKIVEVQVEKIVEVPMVDTEIGKTLKEKILIIERLENEVKELLDASAQLKKELEIEKKKNKKDIYGEG